MRGTAIFALAVLLAPHTGLASTRFETSADTPDEGASIVLGSRGSEIAECARMLAGPIGPPTGLFPRIASPPSFELRLFESALFEFLSIRHGWDSPPPRAVAGTPPVPEPSTAQLLGIGLVGLAWVAGKRNTG